VSGTKRGENRAVVGGNPDGGEQRGTGTPRGQSNLQRGVRPRGDKKSNVTPVPETTRGVDAANVSKGRRQHGELKEKEGRARGATHKTGDEGGKGGNLGRTEALGRLGGGKKKKAAKKTGNKASSTAATSTKVGNARTNTEAGG